MIYVVNKKTHKPTDRDYYIGCPSPLGNPFKFDIMSRENCIRKYRLWLFNKIHTKDKKVCAAMNYLYNMAKRGDVYLVCWCAPSPCHGDVIKQFIEKTIKKMSK